MRAHTPIHYMRVTVAVIVLTILPAIAAARQSPSSIRLMSDVVVMEQARGDSLVLGSLGAGTVVEVLEQRGRWLLVRPPSEPILTWRQGWIHADSPGVSSQRRPAFRSSAGRTLVRGFAHATGTIFTARDSFDAVLGSGLGFFAGAGAQLVFGNGLFVQGSAERFHKTGSRVLVSGEQLFTLGLPHVVTLTPVDVSVGYRTPTSSTITPYLGAGAGWYTFDEEASPEASDATSRRHVSYHVLGGAEIALLRWVSLAGEVQWTAVPGALGDGGVSSLFEEDDLGGTAFKIKVIVGGH